MAKTVRASVAENPTFPEWTPLLANCRVYFLFSFFFLFSLTLVDSHFFLPVRSQTSVQRLVLLPRQCFCCLNWNWNFVFAEGWTKFSSRGEVEEKRKKKKKGRRKKYWIDNKFKNGFFHAFIGNLKLRNARIFLYIKRSSNYVIIIW